MKKCIQYNCPITSLEEGYMMRDGLLMLEGCLNAQVHGRWSVSAHFTLEDQSIDTQVLPDGCRLVPHEVSDCMDRRNALEKRVLLGSTNSPRA